jgi:prohibitin 2
MYRIPETQVVSLFQDYQGDPYLTLIAPRLQEAMKQVTALYKAEDLVQNREGTRSETVKRLQLSVGELVQIVDVNIVNIDLTDELERAIEAKMVQQQDALKKQFELERERTEAEITLVKARAEAEASKVRGEALANAPRVIEMEIIKKWNGIAPSVVVLGEGGAGANVMLPMIPPTPRE